MPWKSPMLIYTSCYRFFLGGMFLGLDSNFCQPLRQEFLQEGRGIRRCGEDGPDPVARRRPDVSWWKHPLTSHSFWHFLTGTIYIYGIYDIYNYIYIYIRTYILTFSRQKDVDAICWLLPLCYSYTHDTTSNINLWDLWWLLLYERI